MDRIPYPAATAMMERERTAPTDWAALDRYVDEHMPAWTEELVEFCRLPTEETQPLALQKAADWTADRLRRLGATVEPAAPAGLRGPRLRACSEVAPRSPSTRRSDPTEAGRT
jgi:hypothetical protein